MSVTPYLFFNGNCSEAMRFYEKTLGGTLQVMTWNDGPPDQVPPNVDKNTVMHSHLQLKDGSILASDDMPSSPTKGMNGFFVSLAYPTADEATRIFKAFSDGGRVVMPIDKTFWTDAFGMLIDRFGTPWMVSSESRP